MPASLRPLKVCPNQSRSTYRASTHPHDPFRTSPASWPGAHDATPETNSVGVPRTLASTKQSPPVAETSRSRSFWSCAQQHRWHLEKNATQTAATGSSRRRPWPCRWAWHRPAPRSAGAAGRSCASQGYGAGRRSAQCATQPEIPAAHHQQARRTETAPAAASVPPASCRRGLARRSRGLGAPRSGGLRRCGSL